MTVTKPAPRNPRSTAWSGFVWALLGAMQLGCGESSQNNDESSATSAGSGGKTTADATSGGSAGTNGPAGGAAGSGGVGGSAGNSSVDTGTGGSSGGGGSAAPNMPSVALEGVGGDILTGESGTDVIASGPEWLKVTSSHYYVTTSAENSLVEGRWLAAVENVGPAIACGILIRPTFYDEDEQVLLTPLAGSVYAPLFRRPGEQDPRACLEPGERGIAIATDLTGQELEVSEVAAVHYTVSASTYDDLESSPWVTLGPVMRQGRVVTGSLLNGDAELGFWRVFVFAEGDAGAPIESQDFSDDQTGIEPGYVWNFETEAFNVPLSGFEVFFLHNVR